MRRITSIGPTPLDFQNSGITSLDKQFPKSQNNTIVDIQPTLPPIEEYVRPADWLSIPDVNSGDNAFYGLFAVFDHDSNVATISANTNFKVDWGDGTGYHSYVANTTISHVYDFASMDNSTLTSRGYKQVVISVLGDPNLFNFLNVCAADATYGKNSTNWLDIAVAGPSLNGFPLTNYGGNTRPVYLEQVKLEQNNLTDVSYLFSYCTNLKNIRYLDISNATNINGMFIDCRYIQTIPDLITDTLSSINDVFAECKALRKLPWIDTSQATGISRISTNSSITEIPAYDITNVQSFYQAFWYNRWLQTVPNWDTKNIQYWAYAFTDCYSLRSLTLDLSGTSNQPFDQTLAQTYSLERLTLTESNVDFIPFNWIQYSGLERFPYGSTIYGTNQANLFFVANYLNSVPEINLPDATSIDNAFRGPRIKNLTVSAPNATSAVAAFASGRMSYVDADLPSVTDISYLFNQSYYIGGCKLNTGTLTNVYGAFWYTRMVSAPSLNLTNITDCTRLYAVSRVGILPDQDMSNVTNLTEFISSSYCYSIPAYDWSNVTNFTDAFNGVPSLVDIRAYGMKYSMNLSSTSLSKSAMEYVFNNLGASHLASQTITVNNLSHYNTAPASKSVTSTAGSKTVTAADTSNLVVGQFVTGTNISDPVAVTFTDSGDTVDLANHGLANGTVVGFTSITSTTGISTYTVYYVINAGTNSFQLSTSVGGSAVTLTTDGSGNMYYANYIDSIVTNTSVTLTAPASASGSTTLTATYLDCSKAIAKGWAVSF